jgi:hypothetical protein
VPRIAARPSSASFVDAQNSPRHCNNHHRNLLLRRCVSDVAQLLPTSSWTETVTDEDYRSLVNQRFDDAEKTTILMLSAIKDSISANQVFSEKQNDAIYNDIRELHKKVDIHNKYIMMLVGICMFVTASVPILVVFLARYVVK